MSTTEVAIAAPTPAAAAPAGTLTEQMRYAQALAGAGLLPKAYQQRPADLLLALAHADALGLPIAVVLSEVHVIDGKPSVSAGLMAALARRAGHRVRTRVDHDDSGRPVVTCEVRRRDDPEYPFVTRWDLDRATRAGLNTKGPWRQYPEQMLRARAVAEAVREACGEVLAGTYTADELDHAHYPATVPSSPEPTEATTDADTIDAELVDEPGDVPNADDYAAGQTPPAASTSTRPTSTRKPRRSTDPGGPSGPLAPSERQMKYLHTLLGQHGYSSRESALAYLSAELGREITTSKDLSIAEASRVIDKLKATPKADGSGPADEPPDDPWSTSEPAAAP